jgi:hypothetical protein
MEEQIRSRMDDTRRKLFESFDEDVHQRLRLQLADAKAQLDRVGQRFWSLTHFILQDRAQFDDAALTFNLARPPKDDIGKGRYHLISKSHPRTDEDGSEELNRFLYRLSHPLGEYVVDGGKQVETPPAQVVFNVTSHPAHSHVIEALRGQSGCLTLSRLAIDSYEREEYLLFSGFDDNGVSLDQETMEKLFSYAGRVEGGDVPSASGRQRLTAEADRHAKATISRSLEQNSEHFNQAREKLEKWADDMVLSAEKALQDTKEQIKALRRQARQAVTLEEQHGIQEKIQKLERQQRHQRQEIFTAEDEIMEKRDALIESLERRLSQKTEATELFTIRWAVE